MHQGHAGRIDARGGGKCTAKYFGLRIRFSLVARAAAGVGLAGEQELLEARGPAERVGLLEDLEDSAGAQLQCPMDVGVKLRDQQAEVAAGVGHRQASGEIADEGTPAQFVSRVARQVRLARRALAEVVHERGEANLERA